MANFNEDHIANPDSQSGKDTGNPKTFTEAEVNELLERRLKGQGKVIETSKGELEQLKSKLAKLEQRDAEFERQRMQEQGKFKELYDAAEAKRNEFEKKYTELQNKEQQRLEKLSERNSKRVETLPEEFRSLIPDGLAPDVVADQIGKLEGLVSKGTRQISVHTSTGGRGNKIDPDEAIMNKGSEWLFGKK